MRESRVDKHRKMQTIRQALVCVLGIPTIKMHFSGKKKPNKQTNIF